MKTKKWILALVPVVAMATSCIIEDECETNDDCLSTEVCVDGECVPASQDITFAWSWTIEDHASATATELEWLCSWANWFEPANTATVRLIVDTDHDTTYDYYYDAQCQWGEAVTDAATDPADYAVGDVIWFAFQFLDSEDNVLAQSAEYVERTLAAGSNDLGNVDFDFGDYGPLDVTLMWGDKIVDPAYDDDCAWPEPDVDIMGYLLHYSDGSVADEVDIDVNPMDCTTELSWLETEFDTYELILDGEDTAGTTTWGSTCIDLEVDDETSNAWSCDVVMTATP